MDNNKKDKKTIALIPARGGSKRLPGKNVKLLAGKPMIGYAIEAAMNSACFSEVIVTTEDGEIAAVSAKFGARIISRPRELATDTAKTIDVVFHAIDVLEKEGNAPQAVALLQATSPLCTADDVKNAVSLYFGSECDSVVSMYEPPTSPYWMFKKEKEYVAPLFGWDYLSQRSQNLPQTLMPNGAIYVASVQTLKRSKNFYTPKTIPYLMSAQRSVDVDTQLDFIIAQTVLENKKE